MIAIICVLGYSFIFTNSKDAKFENSNPSQTETSDNIKKNTTKDTKKSTTKKKTTKKQTTSEITFTKNADGDYSFKLPEGYEAHIVPRSSTFKKWGIIQIKSRLYFCDNS